MMKEDKLIRYLTNESVVKEVIRGLEEGNFYHKEMGDLYGTSIWENKVETRNGIDYDLEEWIKPVEDFYKEKGVLIFYDKIKTNKERKFNIGFKIDKSTAKGLEIKEERVKYNKLEIEDYLEILSKTVEDMTSPEMVEYIEGYVEVNYGDYEVKLLDTIPKRILKDVEKRVKELQHFWERKGLRMGYKFEGEEGSIYYDLWVEIGEK